MASGRPVCSCTTRRKPSLRMASGRPHSLRPALRPHPLRTNLPLRLPSLALLLRRPVISMGLLRCTRHRNHGADSQCQHPSAELESRFHSRLHLLILLIRIVRLHGLRQFRQRLKIR